MLKLDDTLVAVAREKPAYSRTAPFHPSEEMEEWPGAAISHEDNPAYRAVRSVLNALQLDAERFGRADWNPLGEMINPGNTVILKPNFVRESNGRKGASTARDFECLVTHGSVIRAVVDYVAKALAGTGQIVLGDCPVQGCDWDRLVRATGVDVIAAYCMATWPGIKFEIRDFRLCRAIYKLGFIAGSTIDSSGLKDHQEMDLGSDSLLVDLMRSGVQFGVGLYPRERMRLAHTPSVNNYLCPKTILYADVVINIPKMKFHKKAGITCALKNLVGINGHKDYLPHFRFGSPRSGGDEYPDGGLLWDLGWACYHHAWDGKRRWQRVSWSALASAVQVASYKSHIYRKELWNLGEGSWHGNDTLWRTILDINRAFFYFDRARGQMGSSPWPAARYLAIADGLLGGEHESPLCPDPVSSGVILAASSPLALDTVAATLMGFDIGKLKLISEAYRLVSRPLASFGPGDIRVVGDLPACGLSELGSRGCWTAFEPSQGWQGFVEDLGFRKQQIYGGETCQGGREPLDS